jgi:hypothetical protein
MCLRTAILCIVPIIASATAVAQEAPGRLLLTVDKGRATCTIQNYPIGRVLETLGERSGVIFVTAEDVSPNLISLEMADAPVEDVVRRLLAKYDAFYYYGASDDAPSSLRAVWIYRRGSAAGLRPIPPELWAATADLRQAIGDGDPAVRERAYTALMSRPDEMSRELVFNALRGVSEADENIRQRLFSAAAQQGLDVPRDLLADVARTDVSETIRLLALDAMASDATVTEVATALANTDLSGIVRQRAKEILAEWETTASRRRPPQ